MDPRPTFWIARTPDDSIYDSLYAEVEASRAARASSNTSTPPRRNAVVLAFAHLATERGWGVGQTVDEDEPDWPVLLVDTPEIAQVREG